MIIQQTTLEQALTDVLSRNSSLAEEVEPLRKPAAAETADATPALEEHPADPHGLGPVGRAYRAARPVLNVVGQRGQRVVGVHYDAETRFWKERLNNPDAHLDRAIAAVGRIEVKGNGDLTVAGTGFMVRSDVIATNQHVVDQFAEKVDGEFLFRINLGDEEMEASIDFSVAGDDASLEFRITEVLKVKMEVIPDVAFLRVEPKAGGKSLPAPLEFSTYPARPLQLVAAIGYPQRDTRDETTEKQKEIFGDIFDTKRVSPGQVIRIENGGVVHDCSVLRGSSGSPLIDLDTGKVVGIHSVGEFLKDNVAVSAATAREILDMVVPEIPVEDPVPLADAA